ncbi:MAG: PAS domain S-box protein [Gammaproteobacteria bacterium]|nr:PAS domain S-box protein [Gammaproteobacteria bacterium]
MAEQTFGRRTAAIWAAAVFIGIAFAVTGVVAWMYGERVRQLESSTAVVAGQARTHLSAWIDARLAIVETLAIRWPDAYAAEPAAFRRDAERLLERLPGLLAVNWVDAGGTIRRVVPEEANPGVLGSDLYAHPEPDVARALAEAAQTGDATRTRTLELLQGGAGFAIYWPVHGPEGALAGFVNGVVRARELIDTSRLAAELGSDYRLELRDVDGAVTWSNAADAASPWPLVSERRVAIPGGLDLQLSLAPTPLAIARATAKPQFAVLLVSGWLLGALLGWLIWRRVLDQERIRGSERRLREMLNLLPHPVYVKDAGGRFTFVNHALAQACGLAPDDLIGATAAALPGPAAERDEFAAADARVISGGEPVPAGQEWFTDAAGARRLVEITRVPFRDPLRGQRGVIGIGVDVTARHEAEALGARIASALDQAGEAITLLDIEGRIVFANPAFIDMMDFRGRDVRGLTMAAFAVPGSNDDELITSIASTLKRGEPWRERYRSTWSDGVDRVRDATVTAVRDESGRLTGYVGVLRDVTREQQLEDELRQSQKLEAVGQLAGGIAHDFNNLLTVILGYASTLRETVPADSPAAAAAGEIEQASERAASLTAKLLTFSRRRTAEAASADLNAAVRNLAPMVERIIGENISVEVALDEAVGTVSGDAGEFEQIILNLCVNARDAQKDGGELKLWTALRDADTAPADVRPPLGPGSYGVLGVTDCGVGMSAALQERVFEPFFTTKQAGAGTGLGLSMVYGIAEQRGGGVHVESAPGQGTTFTVWLPVTEPAVAEAALQTAAVTPAAAGGGTILVAEDEAGIRELMTHTLQRAGYHVVSATDGVDAMRCAAGLDRVDLLVTDVVMPRMGGLELRDRLARCVPGLPVLFVSGYAPMESGAENLQAGDELLAKPFRPGALLKKVAELLH